MFRSFKCRRLSFGTGTTMVPYHRYYLVLVSLAFLWNEHVHSFAPNLLRRSSRRLVNHGSTGRSSLFPPASSTTLSVISLNPKAKFKEGTTTAAPRDLPQDRFGRTASTETSTEASVLLTVHGKLYNITAWANSHPGGSSILKKFNGKDATVAFEKAAHSHLAYEMLEQFEVVTDSNFVTNAEVMSLNTAISITEGQKEKNLVGDSPDDTVSPNNQVQATTRRRPLWRTKLFTVEDPRGIHKTLGVYVLLHFAYRIANILFGDPSAGLATRCGKGPALLPILCVVPHALLSLSSLIFHTVPRERVVGKPMIWQEFRAHNIIFGVRSVVCTILAWASYYFHHTPFWRSTALLGSSASVLLSNYLADEATRRLRVNSVESTTATMPYWEGCSVATQRKFKQFYAYSQFMATIACLAVGNPAWPLSVLLAIQLASLMMTLVRKGLISARTYHYAYTASLIVPYVIAARHLKFMKNPLELFAYFVIGAVLYQLRRMGVDKYALWVPMVAARVTVGDSLMSWDVW